MRALKATTLVVSVYLGFSVLVVLLLRNLADTESSSLSILLGEIIRIFLIVFLVKVSGQIYLISSSEMGVTAQMPRLNIFLGLFVGCALLLGAGAISDTIKHFSPNWGIVPQEHDLVTIYMNSRGISKAILFFVYGFTTPVIEEVLFRGILHSVLRRAFSLVTTLILLSAIFGVFHVFPVLVIHAFLIGCGLTLLREWGRSLVGPIIAHITINSLSLILSQVE